MASVRDRRGGVMGRLLMLESGHALIDGLAIPRDELPEAVRSGRLGPGVLIVGDGALRMARRAEDLWGLREVDVVAVGPGQASERLIEELAFRLRVTTVIRARAHSHRAHDPETS